MQKLPDIIKIAEIEAAPMGLAVVDTRFSQQGKRRTLEITICRKGGRISLNDCEELSRRLEKVLDEQAPPLIEGSYLLEVQSPGLERQLKTEREFEIFSGEEVEVKTREVIPPLGDSFTGKLHSMGGNVLTILSPKPLLSKEQLRKKKKAVFVEQIPESISLDMNKVLRVCLHPVEPASAADEASIIEN